jgi:hypothetical protein
MEHNFNPNKGDYKYILEEEERKENGESVTPKNSTKQNLIVRFRNWITARLLKRSKRTDKIKLSLPILLEYMS